MKLRNKILFTYNWFKHAYNATKSYDFLKLFKFKLSQKYTMNTDKSKVNCTLSPNLEIAVGSNENKRHLDDDDDEEWVKRIQLDPEPIETVPPRRKLRKFVLLLSYCGKGYLGMQRNPGYRTIEDDILMAMLQAKLIKEESVTCPQIIRFQRAARTDKGVSAVRQIISLKLPDDVDIPSAINEHLCDQIRVMRSVRVTQKFDSKSQCDSRTYSYLTPTFAFAPKDVTNEEYRMTPELIEDLRNILGKYKGVHNFHNFTARVKYNEHRATRYIMDINCSDTFIRDGLEWTLIKVKGQSFMMHQIRKMVGFAISLCKGYVSRDIFDHVWKQERVDIPIAPGLGLVLEEPHYNYYNRKHCSDGSHVPLLWDAEEDEIQAFREKYIDSVIVATEKEEKSMLNWLETLELHAFHRPQDPSPHQGQALEEEDGDDDDAESQTEDGANDDSTNCRIDETNHHPEKTS